ncbi:MAG: alpha/beta fold hydrolase [Saprospiraceae bacterium]|nr:alpha/beta fold hydrolase [Saprospiraceae bacterium]MDW8230525.1 alpha/beta fold hydrolase [Saprospiraceae bacterium]
MWRQAFLMFLLAFGATAWAQGPSRKVNETALPRPVVFVHGFLASGDTWTRFYSDFVRAGYPPERLYAHDWNTLNQAADHVKALDEAIDSVLARTGARQADLIGHSAGGGLAYRYLADSTRAAKVARYVHIGSARQKQPAGPGGRTPTLNLWSDGDRVTAAGGGDIEGATNRMLPGLDHYQVATHPNAFREVYRFLNDSLPRLRPIASKTSLSIGGRAVFFGDNKPASEGSIELYYTDPRTGQRLSEQPAAQTQADAQGRWHLENVRPKTPAELVLRASQSARPVHYFFAGFEQPNPLVYLRALPTGASMTAMLLAGLPDTSAQSVISIYVSHQAVQAERDTLTIDGLTLSTLTLAPPEKTAISFFLFDENGNGRTDGTALNRFARFPFLNGADAFFSPDDGAPVEVYFNGQRQRVRKIPSNQGVQVIVF